MVFSSNADKFIADLDVMPERIETQFRTNVARFLNYSHEELMKRTPVHTGLTVRNWIVTMARPESGYYEEEQTPRKTGNTGNFQGTKKQAPRPGMRLGEEPRRIANEREARRTRQSVDLTNHPYKNIFITNNAPDAWNVEMGYVPDDPYTYRNKGMLDTTFGDLLQKVDREFFK